MTPTTLALISLLACAALYAFLAAFVCIELNTGAHWWCPLCCVLRMFARRMFRG